MAVIQDPGDDCMREYLQGTEYGGLYRDSQNISHCFLLFFCSPRVIGNGKLV